MGRVLYFCAIISCKLTIVKKIAIKLFLIEWFLIKKVQSRHFEWCAGVVVAVVVVAVVVVCGGRGGDII